MSTKARLISTISAICLILALLVTGVWAVSTANVTLGGTVKFTADNIHATITGSITGTQETVSITPLVYDADTVPSDEDKATWNNDVNFGTGNLITMKVKIKNESSERSLFVKVTDNTTTSNINKEFTSTVTDVGSGDTYEVIKGGEIEYTLTLSVAELDYSASANYALDVDLRDANAEEESDVDAVDVSELSYMAFSYNEEDSTASVTGNSIYDYEAATGLDITELDIPAKIKTDGKVYSITSIGSNAFLDVGLTSVIIPEGVISIGYNAFADMTCLTSISLPSTLVTIGDVAFGLAKLQSLTIPENVETIGEEAFYNGLFTSVRIPSKVTSIGSSAFSWCSNLTTIIIDSETVASSLSDGVLTPCEDTPVVNTIYVLTDIVNKGNISEYIKSFNGNIETITEGEYAGYTMYSKA